MEKVRLDVGRDWVVVVGSFTRQGALHNDKALSVVTLWSMKMCHFIFDYNSCSYWPILI